MSLNTAAAYGMYSQEVALNEVVHTLNQAGFDNEDICMMLSPTIPSQLWCAMPACSIRNAHRMPSLLDSSAGSLALVPCSFQPSVSSSGRRLSFRALMVSREGPSLCGNARTLVGLGFSDDEAARFENQLGVLVYVSCRRVQKLCGPAKCCATPAPAKLQLWSRG